MLIIDIIIFLVVLVTLATYLCQSSSKEHFLPMLFYTSKDCENIGVGENRCSEEEKIIYNSRKNIEKARRMSTPRSPLSSRNYKKFFKKKTVGEKPTCPGHECHWYESKKKKPPLK